MFRHQQAHLPAALVKATAAAEVVQADSLMDKVGQLEQEARRLGKKAEEAGDLRAALAAVRELVRIVELLAKLQGEIQDPQGTTIQVVYVNTPGAGKSTGVPSGEAEPHGLDKTVIVDIMPSR
jgi:hypothetical protein